MKKLTFAIIALLVLLASAISAYAYTIYLERPGKGKVTTPAKLTSNVTTFDWGELNQTILSRTIQFTLTNTGDEDTLPLNMTTMWITPTKSLGLITWDRETYVIPAKQAASCQITFTLTNMTYSGAFAVTVTFGAD